MKITFPHIGDAHLIGRIFFSEIGIDIVTPSANTVKSLERGSEISPDEICLPFKLMIANLIDAYHLGADTVVMPATMGPCRLGEYGELLKSSLDSKGYHFQWILLDALSAIGKRELLSRLAHLVSESNKPIPVILWALERTYQIIKELENLDEKAHILTGYEMKNGECKRVLASCRRELSKVTGVRNALKIIRYHKSRLEKIEYDFKKRPIRILLTGEIFSMIEPFANHHIEELLMDMGVSFKKRVTLGWWIRLTFFHSIQPWKFLKPKNKYLPYSIGGYAKETVEEGILCTKKGYDGVIQLFPVGCMPEIVSKAVFSRMMKERELSVLTVIYDEMGGEAGYITRIEAFTDMLIRRKKAEKSKGGRTARKAIAEGNQGFLSGSDAAAKRGKEHVLSGH
jgi:predicted nucleotide-binding protein (sugar kinase/HSP70/actin superfamily)